MTHKLYNHNNVCDCHDGRFSSREESSTPAVNVHNVHKIGVKWVHSLCNVDIPYC